MLNLDVAFGGLPTIFKVMNRLIMLKLCEMENRRKKRKG